MIDAFSGTVSTFSASYRMLGSVAEAEDMVQETWLRWQKQEGGDGREPREWLTTTITRLCIDQLRLARREIREGADSAESEQMVRQFPDACETALSMRICSLSGGV